MSRFVWVSRNMALSAHDRVGRGCARVASIEAGRVPLVSAATRLELRIPSPEVRTGG